jgi:hypothetical protein
MTRALFIRLYCALAAAVLLAACGTGDYQKPVQTFAEATAAAQKSLDGYVAAVVSQAKEQRAAEAVEHSGKVEVQPDDCMLRGSARCRIVYQLDNDPAPVPISPESPVSTITALMGSIGTYADGLQAIATSDSAEKAKTSLAATSGSLQNLAKLVESKGSNLEAFAEPAASAAGWIVGAYIDHVRLNALRDATARADPLIGRAVPVFESTAKVIADAAKAPFANAVTDRRTAFKDNPSDSNLNGLLTAAADYDAVLTAKPDKVFQSLADAHHELTEALKSDDLNLTAVFAKMETLKSQAEELQKIVTAFIAAGKKKE